MMRRRVTILFLWFATLLWIATTIVPHHHHDGILVFGLNLTHVDCHKDACSNSEEEGNCCNNNNCEECPFLKGNNSILTKCDDNNKEKTKISFGEYFDIDLFKYSFTYINGEKLFSHDYTVKTILLSNETQLRAPPFA